MTCLLSWQGRGRGEEVHQDWPQTGIPSDGGGARVTRVLNDQHPPRIVPLQTPGIWDSLSPSQVAEINGSNPRRNRRNKAQDMIIAGNDDEEHLDHLVELLKRF